MKDLKKEMRTKNINNMQYLFMIIVFILGSLTVFFLITREDYAAVTTIIGGCLYYLGSLSLINEYHDTHL